MELQATGRTAGKKTANKQIRREGNIPAILYSKGEKGQEIVIEGAEFKKFLNTIEPGTLSSKIFSIKMDGSALRAIIKDIQYEITTYQVVHLDFVQLHNDIPVILNVPVKCINKENCVGVKEGGTLRQAVRSVKVSCLPSNIPAFFEVDVRNLKLGQALKLSDLNMPKEVRPLVDCNQLAVMVARK